MRWLAPLLIAALAVLLPAASGRAARDGNVATAQSSPYELVVFEADGCIYCEILRRDVVPLYTGSAVAKDAPMRFVNLTYADESGMGLASGINIAPTVVLFQNGAEVDRITGYSGPGNFVHLVGRMMGKPADWDAD